MAYFVLAYAIAWLFWLPLAASSRGLIPVRLPATVFYSLAALGPLLAAVIMSGVEGGWPAIRALLGKVLKWRASIWWYVAAVVAYPGLGWLSRYPPLRGGLAVCRALDQGSATTRATATFPAATTRLPSASRAPEGISFHSSR